jgi:thioredoxin 1
VWSKVSATAATHQKGVTMAVIELTDSTFDEEVKSSDVPVLVDFWAEWCGPCRMVAPTLAEIAGEHPDTLKVAKVNVDTYPELALSFNVTSIPFFIVFKDGEVVESLVGAHPKQKFVDTLTPYL